MLTLENRKIRLNYGRKAVKATVGKIYKLHIVEALQQQQKAAQQSETLTSEEKRAARILEARTVPTPEKLYGNLINNHKPSLPTNYYTDIEGRTITRSHIEWDNIPHKLTYETMRIPVTKTHNDKTVTEIELQNSLMFRVSKSSAGWLHKIKQWDRKLLFQFIEYLLVTLKDMYQNGTGSVQNQFTMFTVGLLNKAIEAYQSYKHDYDNSDDVAGFMQLITIGAIFPEKVKDALSKFISLNENEESLSDKEQEELAAILNGAKDVKKFYKKLRGYLATFVECISDNKPLVICYQDTVVYKNGVAETAEERVQKFFSTIWATLNIENKHDSPRMFSINAHTSIGKEMGEMAASDEDTDNYGNTDTDEDADTVEIMDDDGVMVKTKLTTLTRSNQKPVSAMERLKTLGKQIRLSTDNVFIVEKYEWLENQTYITKSNNKKMFDLIQRILIVNRGRYEKAKGLRKYEKTKSDIQQSKEVATTAKIEMLVKGAEGDVMANYAKAITTKDEKKRGERSNFDEVYNILDVNKIITGCPVLTFFLDEEYKNMGFDAQTIEVIEKFSKWVLGWIHLKAGGANALQAWETRMQEISAFEKHYNETGEYKFQRNATDSDCWKEYYLRVNGKFVYAHHYANFVYAWIMLHGTQVKKGIINILKPAKMDNNGNGGQPTAGQVATVFDMIRTPVRNTLKNDPYFSDWTGAICNQFQNFANSNIALFETAKIDIDALGRAMKITIKNESGDEKTQERKEALKIEDTRLDYLIKSELLVRIDNGFFGTNGFNGTKKFLAQYGLTVEQVTAANFDLYAYEPSTIVENANPSYMDELQPTLTGKTYLELFADLMLPTPPLNGKVTRLSFLTLPNISNAWRG